MAYEIFKDVTADLPRIMDQVYNASQLHSVLGYHSPQQPDPVYPQGRTPNRAV